ncbi:MAG TPA: hypothetical protein VKK61_12100, partial [Tepidisphaeraceae bacterium]|nr:hypothetical protein [Tepidisphaeraceae bacterium]
IAIDGNSHAWVNVEDKNQVVEFNTNARNIVNCWPITGGQQPTGIAMDPQKRRLFIGCRGNNVMVIMNSDNGKILATLPIGQQCDGCAFDPATGDAFASCGDGTLAVIEETSPEKFTVVQTVQTKPGARTMCLDTKSHLIYLPTAEIDPINGNIKPNSFEILVVGK